MLHLKENLVCVIHWTSDTLVSLERVSCADSRSMCKTSMCSDKIELFFMWLH